MSTTARPLPVTARRDAQETDAVPGGWEATARLVLSAFASLRLTVTLFALSCVIVLVGTLAQEELNMLEVKQRYFTSWIAMMRLEDFVPQAFIRHEPFTFEFPFPGGATIGLLLLVNLVAAKLTRFSVHARGTRLASGIAVLAAGFGLTALVISAGHSAEGLQGEPPFSYDLLWAGVAGATAAGWVGAVGAAIASRKRGWRILWITAAAVIGVTLLIVFATGFRLGDPGLRILWQLIKGLGAAAVLLIGCNLVFGPRGGNVLLHFGVGLLMIGQFAFGDRQLEQRLNLIEGDSTNTLINLDAVELAIIDRSNPAEDRVISVPSDRLRRAVGGERTIRDEALPFDLQVLTFYDNSDLLYDKSDLQRLDGENLADAGVGLELAAVPTSKTGGVDSKTNLASAYVRLLDKQSGEPLGTHLVSQWLSDRTELVPDGSTGDHFDTVTVGDEAYELGLRFKRIAKPYWVKLQEVRRIDYSGTSTPRDYSSFIRLVDTETGEDRLERVWMNNPLRYRGETFYQSQYTPLDDGRKMTGIQVVRNSGWLIPYVACAIVGLGMLAHFSGTLNRFLGRREREERRRAEREALRHWGTQRDPKTGGGKKGLPPLSGSEPGLLPAPQGPSRTPVVLTVVGFGLLALLSLVPWQTVRSAIRPEHRQTNMDFYRAGEIPVRFGGRVMPLDAYARQTLKAISNKESLPLENAPKELQERGGSKRRLAALPWLMEVANDSDALRYLPMFRIDSDEVLAEFDLKRNQDKLYSLDQLRANYPRFRTAADAARKKDEKAMTFKEKKLLELDRRLGHFDLTSAAFQLPRPQPIPEHLVSPETTPRERQMLQVRLLEERMRRIKQSSAPAVIPPTRDVTDAAVDTPPWVPFGPAIFDDAIASLRQVDPAPGTDTFAQLLAAYEQGDAEKFNAEVDRHLAVVAEAGPVDYKLWRVQLERWMMAAWPTGVAIALYLAAIVMGLVYFLIGSPRLRTAVWSVIAMTLVIHTLDLACRIAITGRPPVINLYSSAVFIGWALVFKGLVLERIYGRGIGNIVAASSGMMTLMVAYGLDSGDTMPVLQAVLDTQFWLATHVITITLGYAATFLAGALGIAYLVSGWTNRGDAALRRDIHRMTYGIACFAILFSFIGTVLGGLWADDSWGRFWGWDPKENGALLIVIWNALMLHARWDGMVRERGFALLAIGGNIVTAWSWFGTNQLGIGLHSYGFTSGVLMALGLFVLSQLALIAAGWIFWSKEPADAKA